MGMHDCIGLDNSTPAPTEKAEWKGADSDWDPWKYNDEQWAELTEVERRYKGLLDRMGQLWSVTNRSFKVAKMEGAYEHVRYYAAELSRDLVPREWVDLGARGFLKITYDGLHVPLVVNPMMREPDPEIARLVACDPLDCTEDISYWTIISQYGKPYGKAVAIKFLVKHGHDTMFGRDHGPRGLLVIVCREAA